MKKQPQGQRIASPGTMFFAIAAIIWSVCLLAGGVWWFVRTSRPQAVEEATGSTQGFEQVETVPTGLFRYGGSAAWAPIRLVVDAVIQSERREFQLRYIQPASEVVGSKTGLQMLINGDIDIAQSAYPVSEQQRQQAEEQGVQLVQIPVAIDGIAVAVHPALDLPGLTVRQLQAIYQGDIDNWQQVGGPDLKIQRYSRPLAAGGIVQLFQDTVLQGADFATDTTFVATTTEALRILAENPGSLYYASAPELVPQCTIKTLPLGQQAEQLIPPYQPPAVTPETCKQGRSPINTAAIRDRQYPLTHELYVVFRKEDGDAAQAGAAYATFLRTQQGQDLIQSAGFAPLTDTVVTQDDQ